MTGRRTALEMVDVPGPLIDWRGDNYDRTFDFTGRFIKYDTSVMLQKVAFAHF